MAKNTTAKKSTDPDESRARELARFLDSANKSFPNTTSTTFSNVPDVDLISTGIPNLDHAIGHPGIPKGRITEIYGPTGAGKTTLALEIAKQCQEKGGLVAFFDVEFALNRSLIQGMGLDQERLIIARPTTGEETIDMVRDYVNSGLFDMIILDSIAAMLPAQVEAADAAQAFMGVHARLMSRFMALCNGPIYKNNVAMVLLNQVRTNLQSYGAPEDSTGGKAVKFYTSLRIEVRTSPSKILKDSTNGAYGVRVTAKVVKNKLAAPQQACEYNILYGKGVDKEGTVFDVALQLGIVEKRGITYYLVRSGAEAEAVEEKLGVGKDKAEDAFRSDREIFQGASQAVTYVLAHNGIEEPEEISDADVEAFNAPDAQKSEPLVPASETVTAEPEPEEDPFLAD